MSGIYGMYKKVRLNNVTVVVGEPFPPSEEEGCYYEILASANEADPTGAMEDAKGG